MSAPPSTARLREAQERSILVRLDADVVGTGLFLEATPARQRLKDRGWIKSGPRNPSSLRASAGRGARWKLTEAGAAALRDMRARSGL